MLYPISLKAAYHNSTTKEKLTNWADFLHVGSDGITFGYTINLALYFCLLNTGDPLQLYYTVVVTCEGAYLILVCRRV